MTPMNNRLLRPSKVVAGAVAEQFKEFTTYNPDVLYFFDQILVPQSDYSNYPELLNVIQLAAFSIAYGLPFNCTWQIMGAVYDPPVAPSSFYYYFAPVRDPNEKWGLPFGSVEESEVTETSVSVSYNENPLGNTPLLFNGNGECITAEKLLGDDSPWDIDGLGGRSMAVAGGVQILWPQKRYKISQDPAKGAAWCVKRTLVIDNNEQKIVGLAADICTIVDIYHFRTGYTGGIAGIEDSYSVGSSDFPNVLSGGPPTGGWSPGDDLP